MNRYLNEATHQDTVWKRLFSCDKKENLVIALQNDWLLQKWRLFYPDTPEPRVN